MKDHINSTLYVYYYWLSEERGRGMLFAVS
jgi:hypothetical protein